MKKHSLLALTILILSFFSYAPAADLITNGSFETGNFSGWTAINASSAWRLWAVSPSGAGGDDGNGYTPVPTATIVQHGTRSAWNGVTAGTNQSFILYQQVTIPAGQSATVQWIDRYQLNYTQYCGSMANPCGTAQYSVEITNTSDVVLRTLYTVTTANNSNSNTGYVTHYATLGNTYAGQTIRLRFKTLVTSALEGPGQVEIDNVRLNSPGVLSPTAAAVPVGGRVTTADGAGISNVVVTLTDTQGGIRTAKTSSFGYYRFDDVEVGRTYIVSTSAKRYTFSQPSQVLHILEEMDGINFTADDLSTLPNIKDTKGFLFE